ncbi:MAG TPA: hypothetical protein VFI65_20715 [Streptosporangiaceae bacterium]|nr:hypothetical protein [Streptosporangiaceae bacterium]
MAIADILPGRFGSASRLPAQISELRGPARGVVMLPMHLSWPGMRECDVSEDRTRRSMYGMLLSQGKRNDIVRFVNAELLESDWPEIADSLDPKLRRLCEKQFAFGADQPAAQSPADSPPRENAAPAPDSPGAIA